MSAHRGAWFACGVALVLLAVGLLIPVRPAAGLTLLLPALWAAVSATVGGVVAARRPQHPIGWLLLTSGFLLATAIFAQQYANYALLAEPGSLPGGPAMLWLAGWPFDAGYFLLLFLFLLFPTGRLPSPRWRWFARLALVIYVLAVLGRAFGPGPIEEESLGALRNPLGIEAAHGAFRLLQQAVGGLLLAVALGAVGSLLLRLRRARGVERQQLKWFVYASALFGAAAFVVVAFPSLGGPTADLVLIFAPLLGLPVAIGVAVLRYRLYDIDRIINRTLVYGALTAMLGLGYAGVVLVLGQLFGGVTGNAPPWAVAGATLAVAALFQPARRRVQAVVDRRFNRRRYDAARTVEAFSVRLRDELDLDTLTAELAAVVEQTVEPTRALLWLHPSGKGDRANSRR